MELTRIKSFHPDQMGPLFLGGNLPGEGSLISVIGCPNTLRQRARNPLRSRPRRCAISPSTDVLVEGRPLRRFFCIGSGRLLSPVLGGRRSFPILDAIDPPLVGLL